MLPPKVESSAEHLPVLLEEITKCFSVYFERKNTGGNDLKYFDGTFGRGGHYAEILALYPEIKSVVMDQDKDAIYHAQKNFSTQVESGMLQIIHDNFINFSTYNLGLFDMMLLDLGVSSPQLDQAHRGFSFYHDGPLDMRMNQERGMTAEEIVNTATEKELIQIFQEYGEVHSPFRVVRAVVHDRKTKAFQSTTQLAQLIERVDGWRQKGRHPATQYFLALRLAVNQELQAVEKVLPDLMQALKPGGRLAVLTFHSLEDRIVKNIFRGQKDFGQPVNKKVIIASEKEAELNPRSRSAKLRIFERSVQDEPPYRKKKY